MKQAVLYFFIPSHMNNLENCILLLSNWLQSEFQTFLVHVAGLCEAVPAGPPLPNKLEIDENHQKLILGFESM